MIHKLPNGEETDNLEKYLTEWEKIYATIEETLGVGCVGYDPDFMFQTKEGRVFVLPTSIGMELYYKLEACDDCHKELNSL